METPYHRWTPDEEARLVQLSDSYVPKKGQKKWEAIAAQMGGRRTATAVHSRYIAVKKLQDTEPPELINAVVPVEPPVESEPVPEPQADMDKMNRNFKDICEMALAVATGLGKGRAECVYQNAMSVELQQRNMPHTMEEVITIPYKSVTVGHERADIHIYGETFPAVLEMKATNSPIQPKEHWQVISYMRALKRSFGAVINFNQSPKGQLQVDCIILTDDGKPYLWDPDTGTIIGEPLSDYE